MLYLAMIYTVFTKKELKQGVKHQVKTWSEVQGTRLRWIVSYYSKILGKTPRARNDKIMVLKTLFFRVNGLAAPHRSSSKSMDSEARGHASMFAAHADTLLGLCLLQVSEVEMTSAAAEIETISDLEIQDLCLHLSCCSLSWVFR